MFFFGNQRDYKNTNFKPLYTTFLHSVKLSKYRMGTVFEKDPLAVEKKITKPKL